MAKNFFRVQCAWCCSFHGCCDSDGQVKVASWWNGYALCWLCRRDWNRLDVPAWTVTRDSAWETALCCKKPKRYWLLSMHYNSRWFFLFLRSLKLILFSIKIKKKKLMHWLRIDGLREDFNERKLRLFCGSAMKHKRTRLRYYHVINSGWWSLHFLSLVESFDNATILSAGGYYVNWKIQSITE
jgi:hypothetical protein